MMDKENGMLFAYSGVFIIQYYIQCSSSLRKEGHSDTGSNRYEPWGCYADEVSQSQKEKYCMITYMKSLRIGNS